MRRFGFLLVLSLFFHVEAVLTWRPAEEFSSQVTRTPQNIALAYDAEHRQVVGAWSNAQTFALYYAVYDGTNWGSSQAIALGASNGSAAINIAYNEFTDQVFAVWSDQTTQQIYYATYNGISWSNGGTIHLGGPQGGYNPSIGYDRANEEMVAVWLDGGGTPYYSVYSGGSWVSNPLTSTFVVDMVTLAYNNENEQLCALWADNSGSQLPFYSFYNGTSWTTPAAISVGSSAGVYADVFGVFNVAANQLVAVWNDRTSQLPYYSFYNGTNWSPGALIPLNGVSVGVKNNIFLTYDSYKGRVIATWADVVSSAVYYSTYNGSSWAAPALIPPGTTSGSIQDAYSVYDAVSNKVIAAWSDAISNHPDYAETIPESIAPSNLVGNQDTNSIPFQKQYFNQLSWEASVSPDISYYNIYRDQVVIARVSVNSPLRYTDYEINWKNGYTYSVTAVDIIGVESEPVTVFIH